MIKNIFNRQPLKNYLHTSQKWILFSQGVVYWDYFNIHVILDIFIPMFVDAKHEGRLVSTTLKHQVC